MHPRTNLWRVNTLEKTSQRGKCFLLGIALHYRNHNSNFHNQHHHHLLGCILRAKTSFLTPGKNDQPVKLVIWAISESHHFFPGKSSLIGLSGGICARDCLSVSRREVVQQGVGRLIHPIPEQHVFQFLFNFNFFKNVIRTPQRCLCPDCCRPPQSPSRST